MMRWHTSWGMGLLLVLLLGAAVRADSVIKKDKTSLPLRGTIEKMSPTMVVIETKNGLTHDVPVNEIQRIRYEPAPEGLDNALKSMIAGKYAEAQKALRGIRPDEIPDRKLVKGEIAYLKALSASHLALAGIGAPEGAASLMNTFLSDYPKNYHFYSANETMGDLALAAGQPEDALKFYEKAKAPWADSDPRLELAVARSLIAQKKYDEATAKYQTVLDSGLQGPEADRYRMEATLGKAAALAANGQGREGIGLVKDVILSAEKSDRTIHARAYNALGDCYRVMDQPKDAVIQYLHTDTLYFQDPALHAESLARIAQLWETLDKPERAARARKVLGSKYPNSLWAKKP